MTDTCWIIRELKKKKFQVCRCSQLTILESINICNLYFSKCWYKANKCRNKTVMGVVGGREWANCDVELCRSSQEAAASGH